MVRGRTRERSPYRTDRPPGEEAYPSARSVSQEARGEPTAQEKGRGTRYSGHRRPKTLGHARSGRTNEVGWGFLGGVLPEVGPSDRARASERSPLSRSRVRRKIH
jgi:hypothetical protein